LVPDNNPSESRLPRGLGDETHELRKNFANICAVTKRKQTVTDQCEGIGCGEPGWPAW
jgi:hypothetical protein